jgi:sodium/proline symporter
MEYVPTSVGVIIIIAVMSAILSTTDTRLHSVGITTARDIYSYFRPEAGDESLLRISRIATIFFGIGATAIAVDPPGTIIGLYSLRAVLLTSAFLVPLYAKLYWEGIDGRAIIASIVGGTTLGLGDRFFNFLDLPPTFVGAGTALLIVLLGYLFLSGSEPSGPSPTSD